MDNPEWLLILSGRSDTLVRPCPLGAGCVARRACSPGFISKPNCVARRACSPGFILAQAVWPGELARRVSSVYLSSHGRGAIPAYVGTSLSRPNPKAQSLKPKAQLCGPASLLAGFHLSAGCVARRACSPGFICLSVESWQGRDPCLRRDKLIAPETRSPKPEAQSPIVWPGELARRVSS